MAVLYVKKFNLDRNGKRYKAGSFVEMPMEEATRLASSAPAEFEIIKNDTTIAPINKASSAKSKKTTKTTDEKTSEKIDEAKENAENTKVILPPVNPTDGIKKPAAKKTTTTRKAIKKNE